MRIQKWPKPPNIILSSDDFDTMMDHTTENLAKEIPFGIDMAIPTGFTENPDNLTCTIRTGCGDNEDESPPVYDPLVERSPVDQLY